MKHYGFIGLGSQGAPMALRMIEGGLDVVLWARRPESLEPFANTTARSASTIEELGSRVDYCGICVVDDDGVRQICEQLIPAMRPGSCLVIHSTIHPALCRSLADSAAAAGISLLDAPVSGGGGAATAGTLTVMVGGDAGVLEAARPMLATFAGLITHLGGVGAGQMAKLVNNNLMAANLAVAHLAMELAETAGIDQQAFKEFVAVSSGRSFSFEVRGRMRQPTDFAHGAQLLAKDVRLLGEAVGQNSSYQALQAIARGFLDQALAKQ
jgi:3-hydroxyisobutyrate dehydrogenase-like beta-hydroxyacid dehydrogenase